ncbi:MAG TPA: SpoIIE family protein phosphatase, partial [Pirellulaceae bacterium]|nr:SpoIIE family protein phosphatase [Pirellulaceae bacterium]
MIPAPTPADEAERMADLQALRILDTPPEDRFNRIIRLAKGILQVPIAYIALVDRDRQWFKAKCGVTVDQTGREESFCGHAILQKEPLVIPDARLDPRFHDNPLVLGPPHVRFYAGHPLKGPQGHNVGTLCVVSPEPRELSPHERALLGELAAMAEHELSLHDVIESQRELLQTKQALIESQQHLADELAQAEIYVRSLLPEKLRGAITSDYQFVSSSQLGGDIFGYHWLDEQQLAIYLLDVCGHGVGSALLSVSVQHALRSHALPNVRFDQPHEVLTALNQAFPMEEHDGRFFTIWYGVYDKRTHQLRYASGGHPPAILLDAAGNETRLGCA